MAIVKLNSITETLSGKLGNNLVLKRYGKKTIATRRPHARKKRTPAQQACANAFRQAARFAKAATGNPEIKAYYTMIARQRNQHSAYVALIQDFRKSPIPLTQEHLLEQARKATLTKEENIRADEHVLEVTVTTAHGEIIVHGMAVRSDKGEWNYASAYNGIRISIREICSK